MFAPTDWTVQHESDFVGFDSGLTNLVTDEVFLVAAGKVVVMEWYYDQLKINFKLQFQL